MFGRVGPVLACPIPTARATARPVQCVASPGGSAHGSARIFATLSADSGALPGLRVLSRSRPSTPASANRCCQRHTEGRLTPTWPATGGRASSPPTTVARRMTEAQRKGFRACKDTR